MVLDGKIWRSFQPQWLDKFDWLEYSVKKEAAFCFPCFLFKNPSQAARFGMVKQVTILVRNDGYFARKVKHLIFSKKIQKITVNINLLWTKELGVGGFFFAL